MKHEYIANNFKPNPINDWPLDVQNLPEDIYRLSLKTSNVSQLLARSSENTALDETCLITIIKTSPQLTSPTMNLDDIVIVNKNEKLDWQPSNIQDSLFACTEEKVSSQFLDPLKCEAQKSCRDKSAYRHTSAIELSTTGLINVFAISRNKLGQDSSIKCGTFAVSNEPPALALKWKEDALNAKYSALDLPVSSLTSIIEFNHQDIPKHMVAKSLECKVDFVIQGRESLVSDRVICLSGKCQGKPLDAFTSCDSETTFSLSRIWDQRAIFNSVLRFTARVSDGAGHVTMASNYTIIDSNKWKKNSVKNIDFDIEDFESSSEGNLILTRKNGISLFITGEDRIVDLLNTLEEAPKIVKAADHSIYIDWTSNANSLNSGFLKIAKFERNIVTELGETNECQEILGIGKKHIWCKVNDSLMKSLNVDNLLATRSTPIEPLCLQKPALVSVTISDELWIACGLTVLRFSTDGKSDFKTNLALPDQYFPVSLQTNHNSEVWAYYRSKSNNTDGRIVRFSDPHSKIISLPENPNSELISDNGFVLPEYGNPLFAGFMLNLPDFTWKLADESFDTLAAARLIPYKTTNGEIGHYDARGLYINHGPFKSYWHNDITGLRFPDDTLRLTSDARRLYALIFNEDGKTKSLFKLGDSGFTSFDENTLGTPFSIITGIWENSFKDIEIASADDSSIYRLQNDSWKKVGDLNIPGEYSNRVYRNSSGWIYIQTSRGIWGKETFSDKPIQIAKFSELPGLPISFIQGQHGRMWVVLANCRSILLLNGSAAQILSLPETDDLSPISSAVATAQGLLIHTNDQTFIGNESTTGFIFENVTDSKGMPPPLNDWKSWTLPNNQFAFLRGDQNKENFIDIYSDSMQLIRSISMRGFSYKYLRLKFELTIDSKGFVWLEMKNGIYKENSGKFLLEFAASDISHIFQGSNSTFALFYKDASDRIWIVGQSFQVIRLDRDSTPSL